MNVYRETVSVAPAKGQVWTLPNGKRVELMGLASDGVSWSWSGFSGVPGDYGFIDDFTGYALVPSESNADGAERK